MINIRITSYNVCYTKLLRLVLLNLKVIYSRIRALFSSDENNNIEFVENIEDIELVGLENELNQIFLNIINNFDEKDILVYHRDQIGSIRAVTKKNQNNEIEIVITSYSIHYTKLYEY